MNNPIGNYYPNPVQAWGYGTYAAWPRAQMTGVTVTNARMGDMKVDELRLNMRNNNPYDPNPPDLTRMGSYTTEVAALRAAASDANLSPSLNWYMRYSDTSDLRVKFRPDGITQLNGKLRMLGIPVPFQMDLKLGVTPERNVSVEVTKSNAFGFLPVPAFFARNLLYQQMKKADPGDSHAPLITPYGNMDYLLLNTHVIYAANNNLHKQGASSVLMDLQHLPVPVQLNLQALEVSRGQLAVRAGNGSLRAGAKVAGSFVDRSGPDITPFFSTLARQGLIHSVN